MNNKKKFSLVAIFMLVSLVLAACGFGGEKDSKSGNKAADEGNGDNKGTKQELNLAIMSEPPSLNPQLATDTTSSSVLFNVFEGLTRLDENADPQEAMAEKIDMSEDGLTYTFTLRDAKWSNGDAVTAGDFKYAWLWALNPENASEYAAQFHVIKGGEAYNKGKGSAEDVGIEAKDDKTLVVTLNAPTAYFLSLTAFYTYMPVNEKVATANPKWYAEAGEDYVTNGPFTLDDWQHNSQITLKKYNDYWDAANVKLETVNIAMVEKEDVATTMFKSGEIDFLGNPYQSVALNSIEEFKASDQLKIEPNAGIYMYKFNTKDEVMANANIRRALTLAMDRQGLIDNILKGGQGVAKAMVPPVIDGFEDDQNYFKDNDVEGAKVALEAGLKELGLKDASELNIKISYNTSEAHASVAQYIQENWKKTLGITASLDNSEWQVYLDKVSNGDYQVARKGWIADFKDAYTFLEMYMTVDNGNNDTGWEDPKYKALMEQSATEVDVDKRIALMKEAEGIFMEALPYAPIYYYSTIYVAADKVKNMHVDPIGTIQLKNVEIVE